MENKIIILGTAHLDSTPGKCSPDGKFREFRYSRELCQIIQGELVKKGYECYIDFEDDDMPGLNSSQELCQRVKIVNGYCNQYGSGNCIYVSVHVNAARGDGKWHNATGWECYTTPGQNNSDRLSNCLYEAAHEILDPLKKRIRTDMRDGDEDQEANFYVIKKANCPAVLTENFFQDCKSDVEWLTSEEGKQAIVDIHVNGILKFLNKN